MPVNGLSCRGARTLLLACLVAAGAAAFAACGGDEEGADTTATEVASNRCGQADVELPPDKQVEPAKGPTPAGKRLSATVVTSLGEFEIALDTKASPKTTASFAHLAEEGFYDGLGFHRVVEGFLIQGGDPLGNSTGGPGYCVDEPPPDSTTYRRGTVAMARSAVEPAGRSGSQFFVVTAADAGLPPEYAVLGRVSSGEKTVEAIEDLADPELGPAGGEPTEPVTIETVEISR